MSVTKSIDPGLCVQKLLELLLNVINQWMPTPVHKGYVWEVYVHHLTTLNCQSRLQSQASRGH